ncbi:MAG: helix-turn-helix protein [Firmicutes bacterium]|nr:helix-turn-helix protein [Bacillota bacterium]
MKGKRFDPEFKKDVVKLYLSGSRTCASLSSQYRLYKEARIGQSTLSQIESGIKKSPNAETLRKIANALEVSMAEFDDQPLLKRAYDLAATMNLDDKRKNALEKIKTLPVNEQQERLNRSIEKLKNLPPESRKAVESIIDLLSSPPRQ